MSIDNQNLECIDTTTIKEDFPILSRIIDGNPLIYLDNAATTLKPKQVITEITRYYAEISANIHRGKHYLSEEASTDYEEGRYKVAQFIGSAGNEVVFVKNTTEALNIVAGGLNIEKNDHVVVCTDSHHSNYLPWTKRANTVLVRIDKHGYVDLNHYEELLKLGPKVVALTHCSNVSGLYLPVAEMTRMAKKVGAVVVLDAAQSIPHRRINVGQLGIDFMAFSAHKMLGPTGIGILFGRNSLLNEISPVYLGGGMVDWVDISGYQLRKIPHRFEAGTPHISGVYGLTAAIKYLEKIGFENLKTHDLELGRLLFSEANKRDYLEVVTAGENIERSAILSFKLKKGGDVGNIARMLSDSYGIMCRSGHMCSQPYVDYFFNGQVIRASCYFYNTKQNIMELFRALDELEHVF